MADPGLGGAPPLFVPRFELRVLKLAPGASSPTKTGDSPATTAASPSSSSSSAPGAAGDGGGDGEKPGGGANSGAGGGEDGAGGAGSPGEEEKGAALLLSAAVVESHPLDAGENAICMTLVRLEQGGSPRMYVAVGTGMDEPQGEDKAVRKGGEGKEAQEHLVEVWRSTSSIVLFFVYCVFWEPGRFGLFVLAQVDVSSENSTHLLADTRTSWFL